MAESSAMTTRMGPRSSRCHWAGQHEVAPAQAAQLDLAALVEPDLLLEVGVGLGQLAHDPRDEHLAAVREVGDARRLDHRAPVEVVLERHGLAGVHAHAHAQVGRGGERQCALDVDGAAQRGVGAGEGEQVAVAERLDQRAAVRVRDGWPAAPRTRPAPSSSAPDRGAPGARSSLRRRRR
jgi:hypothetical protein